MIDIENDVIDAVYPFLSGLVPNGGLVSEYVHKPAFLPHVYLSEIDNTPDGHTLESGEREWSSIVTYEAQVYGRSKPECRSIQAALDEAMVRTLGFRKLQAQFIPNMEDAAVYRIVARYTAGVTRTGDLYKP